MIALPIVLIIIWFWHHSISCLGPYSSHRCILLVIEWKILKKETICSLARPTMGHYAQPKNGLETSCDVLKLPKILTKKQGRYITTGEKESHQEYKTYMH